MTAIVGLIDRSEPDLGVLTQMLDAMPGRGPCNPIGAVSGPARLGAGHLQGPWQPGCVVAKSANPDQPWLISADCRLDNEDALRTSLGGKPTSGAALILEGYRRWGEAVVDHLEGDFAFAVWDPDRRSLFFARDRFGIKPFVYLEQPGRFVFASEPKALLALAQTPRRVPKVRMAEFVAGHPPAEGETFFADIRRLPPASCGVLGESGFRIRRYWRLSLPARSTETRPGEAFRALFDDAVHRRMTPGLPLVSMLSGGLDSSSICAIAERRLATQGLVPLSTLSMVFPGRPEGDEQPFIDAVLACGTYAPEFVRIGSFDPFKTFRESLQVQDGPVLAPALTLNRDLYRAVPTGGVMLSGHGGDEVVSKGEGHLNDLARARDWKGLWKACAGVTDLYGTSRLALFWSLFEAFGPGRYKMRALRKALSRTLSTPGPGNDILAPTLASTYGDELRRRENFGRRGRSGRALDLATVADPLQAYALEILDRESSAVGIDSRYPFFDERLIQFSLSLDPSTKLKDGWTRMVLREAMPDLPDAVRWRRDKHDFAPVIVRGLLNSPAAAKSRFASEREALSAYVDLERVEAARSRLEAGKTFNLGADAQALWRTAALSEWIIHARAQRFTLL